MMKASFIILKTLQNIKIRQKNFNFMEKITYKKNLIADFKNFFSLMNNNI